MPRSFRSRRARISAVNDISLTPLIDTALTLLVIFMVATPMMHNAIKVSLPKGNAKESLSTKQNLVVSIDKSGTIFFDNVKHNSESLIALLQEKIKNDQ